MSVTPFPSAYFRPQIGKAPLQQAADAFRAALAARPLEAAAAYSMRDVVSFLSTRSPAEAVAEADAIGIDAQEAAARAHAKSGGAAGAAEGLVSSYQDAKRGAG